MGIALFYTYMPNALDNLVITQPIKIVVLNRKPKAMKTFDSAEWKHYDREHFGRDIKWDSKVYFLKAYSGRKIMGTMELKVEGGVGEIKTLLVKHTMQRQGVGRALVSKAEKITKTNGGHKLFLTTGEGWRAVSFYKAIGFEQTAKLSNHYFSVDFIEMSKFI
ncbi:MAG: GNAT family N-acetyltransferase [Candidatus Levybacteria bacterium]|nr:GNAT family N-acetyltransferase [Candidatus Levybacteria bacterium]MBI2622891.1 GNAT family N-acetyltransferase [Candidatus Levybacteria bacterium]MBI3092839.1 GNAT family N-acetyltransferase [Candidatus Levybacteria bacterium]